MTRPSSIPAMSNTDEDAGKSITLHIKGPSALKLSVTISKDQTVLQLKERIAMENNDFPAESQRLIYSCLLYTSPSPRDRG